MHISLSWCCLSLSFEWNSRETVTSVGVFPESLVNIRLMRWRCFVNLSIVVLVFVTFNDDGCTIVGRGALKLYAFEFLVEPANGRLDGGVGHEIGALDGECAARCHGEEALRCVDLGLSHDVECLFFRFHFFLFILSIQLKSLYLQSAT